MIKSPQVRSTFSGKAERYLCSILVVMLISTLENTNSSRAVQVCTTSFDEFCSARKEHCKWKLFSKIQSSLLREMWFCKKCSTSLLFSPFHFFSKVLLTSLTLATCCRARNWKKLINLIFIIQYIVYRNFCYLNIFFLKKLDFCEWKSREQEQIGQKVI